MASDYACAPCPAHSTSKAASTRLPDCTCRAGYYDDDLSAANVRCVTIPKTMSIARNHNGTPTGCQSYKMRTALHNLGSTTSVNFAVVGAMLRFLNGIAVRTMYEADFELLCSSLFAEFSTHPTDPSNGIICGKQHAVFGKGAKNSTNNYRFLGTPSSLGSFAENNVLCCLRAPRAFICAEQTEMNEHIKFW